MLSNYGKFTHLIPRGVFAVWKQPNIPCSEQVDRIRQNLAKDVKEEYKIDFGIDTIDELVDNLPLRYIDPLRDEDSGVLVLGTRNSYLLDSFKKGEKQYEVTAKLGLATDTHCEHGTVLKEGTYNHVTENIINKTLKRFWGRTKQTKPLFKQGPKLRKKQIKFADLNWTRDGYKVDNKIVINSRNVTCYDLEISQFHPPYVSLAITCCGHFSIHSFIHDFGTLLESGAVVTDLKRTRHGPLSTFDALTEENWKFVNIVQSIMTYDEVIKQFHKDIVCTSAAANL